MLQGTALFYSRFIFIRVHLTLKWNRATHRKDIQLNTSEPGIYYQEYFYVDLTSVMLCPHLMSPLCFYVLR